MANRWKERQKELGASRVYDASLYPTLFRVPDETASSVLLAVIKLLDRYLYEKPLMFRPEDNLEEVLGIDQDEAMDVVAEAMRSLGHADPSETVQLPIVPTVGDLYEVILTLHTAT